MPFRGRRTERSLFEKGKVLRERERERERDFGISPLMAKIRA